MPAAPFRALAAVLLLATPILARGIATAQAPRGELWEATSQMSMEGMPMKMPSRTAKVCSPVDWKEPPGGQRNCKNSNMKVDGNKVTWEVQCTGPTMTGTGEILREGSDAYSGTIKLASDQGNMTIKLTGKKIGGCDNPQ
jgi:hypothetical protein